MRDKFTENISCASIPDEQSCDDVNVFAKNVSDVLYECARRSQSVQDQMRDDLHLGRWERLLRDTDDARVWKAISWKGDFETDKSNEACPSDKEFKNHFERVLNPIPAPPPPLVSTQVTIPVPDELKLS